ncbi:MAG TPA: FkbM family methyltransferase [Candidatus Deferrimicrobiaceae bacterium]
MSERKDMGAGFKRLVVELSGIGRVCGPATLARYSACVIASIPEILKSGTLVPADRRMGKGILKVRPLGTEILVDGAHWPGVREMYCRNVYLRQWKATIKPGDRVVDLGANVGLFSLLAASAGARVIAVEGQSGFIPEIGKNLERNGVRDRVSIEFGLIGAGTGVLSGEDGKKRCSHWFETPPVLSMASLLEKNGFDGIDFLKMDIEGSEFDLFASAGEWLDSVGFIAMEIHPRFGDVVAFRKLLESRGFEVEASDTGGGRIRPEEMADPARSDFYLYARGAARR